MLKNNLVISGLTSVLVLIGLVGLYAVTPKIAQTHYSPGDDYKLVVRKVPMLIAMPGQGNDHMAIIELYKSGTFVEMLSHRSDEAIMLRDIEIEWSDDYVSFGVARGFDLP